MFISLRIIYREMIIIEEILKKELTEDADIEILNGRYYKCGFSNIKHLDTKDLEHKTKTKLIRIKYDDDNWIILLERWI